MQYNYRINNLGVFNMIMNGFCNQTSDQFTCLFIYLVLVLLVLL